MNDNSPNTNRTQGTAAPERNRLSLQRGIALAGYGFLVLVGMYLISAAMAVLWIVIQFIVALVSLAAGAGALLFGIVGLSSLFAKNRT